MARVANWHDEGSGELGVLLPEFGPAPAGADPETARARLFEVLLDLASAPSRVRAEVLAQLCWALMREDRRLARRGRRDRPPAAPYGRPLTAVPLRSREAP